MSEQNGSNQLLELEAKFSFFERNFSITKQPHSTIEIEPDGSGMIEIDLTVAEAMSQIKILAHQKKGKILAFNAQNLSAMLSALKMGAAASTHQDIAPDKMALVRQSLEQDCILIDSPQTHHPYFFVLPPSQIAPKLAQYQQAVTREIFYYWRASDFLSPPLYEQWGISNLAQTLIQREDSISLIVELSRIIKDLCQRKTNNLLALLDYLQNYLEKWYFNPQNFVQPNGVPNCCLAVLRTNTCSLKQVIFDQFRRSLALWEQAGSYTLSQWLKELISPLRESEIKEEQSRLETWKQLTSARNAYAKLRRQLQQVQQREVFASALKALEFQLGERIQAEASSLAGQIIHELIEEISTYQERVIATDHFLYQRQKKLEAQLDHASSTSSFAEFTWSEAQIKQFATDFSRLRDCLSETLGKSFSSWGNLAPDEEQILLEEVNQEAINFAWAILLSQY